MEPSPTPLRRRLHSAAVLLCGLALLVGGLSLPGAAPALAAGDDTGSAGAAGRPAPEAGEPLSSVAAAAPDQPGDLEGYALALINQARQEAGLAPLAWDPLAARAARRHAEELVTAGYLSHLDRQGRSPLLRYALAGGTAFLQENLGYGTGYPPDPAGLRQFLQDTLRTMLAQRPPHDAHRQNILDPAHTAVGIGLAASQGRLAVAQEFVNQYVALEGPALRQARPGQEVLLAGQAVAGYRIYAVQVCWEPLPAAQPPPGAASLPAAAPYRLPEVVQTVAVAPPEERFRLPVRLAEPGRPGLYTLLLWALDPAGRPLPVATVIVLAEDPTAA